MQVFEAGQQPPAASVQGMQDWVGAVVVEESGDAQPERMQVAERGQQPAPREEGHWWADVGQGRGQQAEEVVVVVRGGVRGMGGVRVKVRVTVWVWMQR